MTKFRMLSIIMFFFFAVSLFAQEEEKPVNLTGKWALQFQINDNFTLGNYQGLGFSGKFHFSNHSAVRVGVDFESYSSDFKINNETVFKDSSVFVDEEYQMGTTKIKINMQYLYYNSISNSISMFLGVGVSFSGFPGYQRRVDNSDQLLRIDNSNTEYGVDVLMGVEWFVRSNIGILAEYSSGYSYQSLSSTQTRFPDDNVENELGGVNYLQKKETSSTVSSFSNHSVKFGVSVYF